MRCIEFQLNSASGRFFNSDDLMTFGYHWLMKAVGVHYLLGVLFLAGVFSCSPGRPEAAAIDSTLELVRKKSVPDRRLAVFDVDWCWDGDRIRLSGQISSEQARQEIARALLELTGSEPVNEIVMLPDSSLKGKGRGLVTVCVGNLRREPRQSSELVSQVLLGMELRLLEERDEWFRVQGPDAYLGWLESGSFRVGDEAMLEDWSAASRKMVRAVHSAAFERPDQDSRVVSALVAGSVLLGERALNGWTQVRLPDGVSGFVREEDLQDFPPARPADQAVVSAVGVTALRFLGTSYLWGGNTSNGMDCSGLVQRAFALHGVQLPRDANQQSEIGNPIDPGDDWSGCREGDLMFFGSPAGELPERVTHVALSLGGGDFIHASVGRVRIGGLREDSPRYDSENRHRFLRVRRLAE